MDISTPVNSLVASERQIRFPLSPTDAVLCVLAALLVTCAYYLLLDLRVYGYDEPLYYADFTFKLKEEGRWVNFLLHDFLRKTPLRVDAGLFVLTAWTFLYRIARVVTTSYADALLLSAALLVSSPFSDQSLWPSSLLPALITLIALSFIASRTGGYKSVYLLGGVALFGMLQNYYFVLPLFFLREFELRNSKGREYAKLLFSHGIYWVAGAVLGVLVSLAAVYIITGQVGITPAPWRQTQPIHSGADALRNLAYVATNLREKVVFLTHQGTNGNRVFGLIALLLLVFRLKDWKEEFARAIVLVAIGISFFAFSLPFAPVIQTRSVVNLSTALVLLCLIPFRATGISRLLSCVLLAWGGWNMAIQAHSGLLHQKLETEYVLSVMERQLPHAPYGYKAIALFGQMDTAFPEARVLNSPPQMVAIARATGAQNYIDCRPSIGNRCQELASAFNLTDSSPSEHLVYMGTQDHVAVFAIRP
jgi:hypothetical protein